MGIQAAIQADCEHRTKQALAQVDTNADVVWKSRAEFVVLYVAGSQEFFSSNDIWPYLDEPREPRALGTIMKAIQALGCITSTETFTKSNRPTQHNRPIRVWRSLVCRPEQP